MPPESSSSAGGIDSDAVERARAPPRSGLRSRSAARPGARSTRGRGGRSASSRGRDEPDEDEAVAADLEVDGPRRRAPRPRRDPDALDGLRRTPGDRGSPGTGGTSRAPARSDAGGTRPLGPAGRAVRPLADRSGQRRARSSPPLRHARSLALPAAAGGTPPRRSRRRRAPPPCASLEPAILPGDHEVGLLRDARGHPRPGRLRRGRSPPRARAPTSPPVSTSVTPARGRAPSRSTTGVRASGRRPRGSFVEQREVVRGRANHSWTLRAISGPISGTSSISCSDAAASASSEPNARASTWATCEPTCGMLSATSSRHSGRSLAFSIELEEVGDRAVSANPSSWARSSAVSEKMSAGILTSPRSSSWIPVL